MTRGVAKHVPARVIANEFGMTPRHWTRMAASGKIPGAWQPSGEGGTWLFDIEAFRRWRASTQRKVAEWPGYTRGAKSIGRAPSVPGRSTERPLEQEIDGWLRSAIGSG